MSAPEPTVTEPGLEAPVGGAEPEAPYPAPSVPYWPEPCYSRDPAWCSPSDYDLHPVAEPTVVVAVAPPPTLPETGAEPAGLIIGTLALCAGLALCRIARRATS